LFEADDDFFEVGALIRFRHLVRGIHIPFFLVCIVFRSQYLNITIINVQLVFPLDHEVAFAWILHFDLYDVEAELLLVFWTKFVGQDVEYFVFLVECDLLDQADVEFFVDIHLFVLFVLRYHVDINTVHVGSDHENRLFFIRAKECRLPEHFIIFFELIQD
jgi:hypothetical protein